MSNEVKELLNEVDSVIASLIDENSRSPNTGQHALLLTDEHTASTSRARSEHPNIPQMSPNNRSDDPDNDLNRLLLDLLQRRKLKLRESESQLMTLENRYMALEDDRLTVQNDAQRAEAISAQKRVKLVSTETITSLGNSAGSVGEPSDAAVDHSSAIPDEDLEMEIGALDREIARDYPKTDEEMIKLVQAEAKEELTDVQERSSMVVESVAKKTASLKKVSENFVAFLRLVLSSQQDLPCPAGTAAEVMCEVLSFFAKHPSTSSMRLSAICSSSDETKEVSVSKALALLKTWGLLKIHQESVSLL